MGVKVTIYNSDGSVVFDRVLGSLSNAEREVSRFVRREAAQRPVEVDEFGTQDMPDIDYYEEAEEYWCKEIGGTISMVGLGPPILGPVDGRWCWEFLFRAPGSLKYFRCHQQGSYYGRIACADNSGRYPHETDDGILWVDTDKEIFCVSGNHGNYWDYGFHVPVTKFGEGGYRTSATLPGALELSRITGMPVVYECAITGEQRKLLTDACPIAPVSLPTVPLLLTRRIRLEG